MDLTCANCEELRVVGSEAFIKLFLRKSPRCAKCGHEFGRKLTVYKNFDVEVDI